MASEKTIVLFCRFRAMDMEGHLNAVGVFGGTWANALLVMKYIALAFNCIIFWAMHKLVRSKGKDKGISIPVESRNVALVTAHPDDESMFFLPTIRKVTVRVG